MKFIFSFGDFWPIVFIQLVSSVILVTLSCEGAGRLQSDMEFRSTLKAHITAIVEGSPNLKEEAEKLMPNVAVQVVEDVSKALAGQNASAGQLSEDTRQLITGQILELGKCDSRVRQIISKSNLCLVILSSILIWHFLKIRFPADGISPSSNQ